MAEVGKEGASQENSSNDTVKGFSLLTGVMCLSFGFALDSTPLALGAIAAALLIIAIILEEKL